MFGVGILEAPTRSFEQNDVFAYAFESLWRVGPNWGLSLGTRGRASTRRVSPIGAGDLGEVRASVEWRRGKLAIDAGLGHGYSEMSGDWSLRAGVAWVLGGGVWQPVAKRGYVRDDVRTAAGLVPLGCGVRVARVSDEGPCM